MSKGPGVHAHWTIDICRYCGHQAKWPFCEHRPEWEPGRPVTDYTEWFETITVRGTWHPLSRREADA